MTFVRLTAHQLFINALREFLRLEPLYGAASMTTAIRARSRARTLAANAA